MNILLITQDSPFYLAENIDYLLGKMPPHSRVVGCVMLSPSPFGKKKTPAEKMTSTFRIFGLGFFANYAARYALSRLDRRKRVGHVLKKHGVAWVLLTGDINSRESLDIIRNFKPDLMVSIQGNQIFRCALLGIAPKGTLNVHTALLPKYRGLMPTFWVMRNNEKETGVSVFFVDEGIDSGPIIVQKRVTIGDMSLDQLIRHTKQVGMDAILEAIDLIERGGYTLIENREEEKTYFSFPTGADVKEFKRRGKRFF